MKFAIIVLVAFCAGSLADTTTPKPPPLCPPETVCPQQPSDDKTVLIAHPVDCTRFCQCQYKPTVAIEQRCGVSEPGSDERLHFSEELGVCTWPWEAGCDPNATPPPY